MDPAQELFSLSARRGIGVSCNEQGLFVGDVALLERSGGSDAWQPRPKEELSRELSKCYGLDVEIDPKISGLSAVARALSCGQIAHAQIVALHLRFPDPARIAKSGQTGLSAPEQAGRLGASGLLKVGWDSSKHPRWPAGSSGGVGGEFAPSGAAADPGGVGGASVRMAQVVVPIPFEAPTMPFETPTIPGEIGVPPPFAGPGFRRPQELKNPYPDRARVRGRMGARVQILPETIR